MTQLLAYGNAKAAEFYDQIISLFLPIHPDARWDFPVEGKTLPPNAAMMYATSSKAYFLLYVARFFMYFGAKVKIASCSSIVGISDLTHLQCPCCQTFFLFKERTSNRILKSAIKVLISFLLG